MRRQDVIRATDDVIEIAAELADWYDREAIETTISDQAIGTLCESPFRGCDQAPSRRHRVIGPADPHGSQEGRGLLTLAIPHRQRK